MSLDGPATVHIEALAEQLDAQAVDYRAILAIGAQQRAALNEQDLTAFHGLLAQKTAVMESIAERDRTAAPYRAVWEAHRHDIAAPLRDRLRKVIEELRALLEQLLVMERECEAQLGEAKRGVERELQQLGQGRQALQSYQPQYPDLSPPRLDLGG